MSKACAVCKRGYLRGMNRSHSNRATVKRQYTNLQSTKFQGNRIVACARCIKTITKNGTGLKPVKN